MKKIAFIVNRTIKGREKTLKLIEQTFKGFEVKFFQSEYAGHLSVLAETAVNRGYKNIISVGGDGSLNECINGILQAFKQGLGDVPESYDWAGLSEINVGLLPHGTGNDFAKTAGVTSSAEHLLSLIQRGKTEKIDIGLASFISKKEVPTSRFFINITDVGMGGVVVQSLEKRIPFLSRNMQYMWAIAKTFTGYENSGIRCYNETFQWEGKVMNFVVANGKYFGSGLGIAPEASITDGFFEIVIMGDVSMFDYLTNLGDVRKCKKIIHPEIIYHKADKITIVATDGKELGIDMDGEFVGYAPMTVVNLSSRLNFFM